MKQAVIDPKSGLVENVILAEPGFKIPDKLLVPSDTAEPGDTYDAETGTFTGPPEPEPPTEEELLAAERAGMVAQASDFLVILAENDWITEAEYTDWLTRKALPDDVQAMIEAIPNKGQRIRALRYALGANTFERNHPMVEQIAEIKRKQLGMSEEDMALALDDLFRAAMQIEA